MHVDTEYFGPACLNRRRFLIAGLGGPVLQALPLAAVALPARDELRTLIVSGQVLDASHQRPLPDTPITIHAAASSTISTRTDADGRFVVSMSATGAEPTHSGALQIIVAGVTLGADRIVNFSRYRDEHDLHRLAVRVLVG